MIKVVNKKSIKELINRHIGFSGNYKMNDIDFKLYLKYMSLPVLHTYQGFKDFKKEDLKMKNKILCAKWGKCKATQKCPLERYKVDMSNVCVYGKCANKNVEVIVNRQLEEFTRNLYKNRQKDRQPPRKKK